VTFTLPVLSNRLIQLQLANQFYLKLTMSKIAFIGDIHGYAPALKLALEWCRKENVDSIVGLGDFVDGYNANDKCVQLIQENFAACVRGNHDEDHDQQLLPAHQQWLSKLPESIEFDDWLVTHSSPRPQPDEYIKSSVDAWNCFDDCQFKLCVVGHSHHPMLYHYPAENKFDSEALDASGQGQTLHDSHRYLLVNPSLAYNRSGQQNPGFSVYDAVTQRLKLVYLNLPQIDRRS